MSNIKHHIVFFTGAGISQESGITTFRDKNGLWENHKIEGKFISRISALITWPHLAFGCSAGSTPVRSATNSSTARATCAENMNTSAE